MDEFGLRKAVLTRRYEFLRKHSLGSKAAAVAGFDRSKYDPVQLSEDLRKERFIFTICGEVNCGKSTLLNALVFGETILPDDGTPHTAALIEINYGTDPCAEVEFFSQSEWQSRKSILEQKYPNEGYEQFRAQITEALERHGVNESDVIKSKSLVKQIKIAVLDEYVTPVEDGKKGIFSPFVKIVRVFYPAEILKHMIFVDSPGLNDPDPVRSQVTLDRITRSIGVAYSIYASQIGSNYDHVIMEKYLGSVDSNCQLCLLTKVDLLGDDQKVDVHEYLTELREDEVYSRFLDPERTIWTSGKAELFRILTESGKKFKTSDEKEDFQRLKESGFLDPEINGFAAFRAAVSEMTMRNKGEDILRGHEAKQRSWVNDLEMAVKQKHLVLKEWANKAALDREEIESGLSKIEQDRAEFHKVRTRLQNEASNRSQEFSLSLREINLSIQQIVHREIDKELAEVESIASLQTRSKIILRRSIERASFDLSKVVLLKQERFTYELNSGLADLKNAFKGISQDQIRHIEQLLSFKVEEALRAANEKVSAAINSGKVEATAADATPFWGKYFYEKRKDVKKVKNALDQYCDQVVGKFFNEIKASLEAQLHEQTNQIYGKIEEAITRFLNELEAANQEVLKRGNDHEAKASRNKMDIQDVEALIDQLNSFRTEFEKIC